MNSEYSVVQQSDEGLDFNAFVKEVLAEIGSTVKTATDEKQEIGTE